MTRRTLLASAALLAGCGSAGEGGGERQPAHEAAGGTSTLADVALLNDALAAERRVVERLRAARGVPDEVVRRAEGHPGAIEAAITSRGGRVRPLDLGPAAGDPVAALEGLVALYVDVMPKLSEPRLRSEVAGLLADASEGAAQLRAARGEEPAPEAFVAGLRPEEQRR